MANINIEQISVGLSGQLDSLLASSTPNVRLEIQDFIVSVKPEIDAAILANDLLSLSFIQDRIDEKMAMYQTDASQLEKEKILATIKASLEILVRVGIVAAISVA